MGHVKEYYLGLNSLNQEDCDMYYENLRENLESEDELEFLFKDVDLSDAEIFEQEEDDDSDFGKAC